MNSHDQGLVLFGHGARDPRWADTMKALAERIGALNPGVPLQLAFLEFMSPDLSVAVDALVAQGVRTIVVVPVFLASGGHVLRDLPDRLVAITDRHPGLKVTVESALGSQALVIDAMAGVCVNALQRPKKPVDE
jgi:sirohydrochlorin cobaltochelatase